MNIITHAILINSRNGNEVSSIGKLHSRCLTYVEQISNVARYEFTSIAVFQKGVSVETTETLLNPPLSHTSKLHLSLSLELLQCTIYNHAGEQSLHYKTVLRGDHRY